MSQITVMDPLGGPGEAPGLRRLRYLVVASGMMEADAEGRTPEEQLVAALLGWLGPDGLEVLAVPPGTVILAIDPETGACVWGTGVMPEADAYGNPMQVGGPAP